MKKLNTEKTACPNLTHVHGETGCGNPNPGDVAETMARSIDMRRQRQHNRNVWYGGLANDRPRHKQFAAAYHSEDTPLCAHAYMVLSTAAAVRQGNPNPGDVAETMARSMGMRRQRQHSRNMWYCGVINDRLRHKQLAAAYHSEDTPSCAHAYIHGVANCCCCAAGLYVALCSPHVVCCLSSAIFAKKKTEKLRAEKTASPNLTYVHGDRGCGNPGSALNMPKAKKVTRAFATRDTLHGSRPNLGQRDPKVRTVPTPSDVSDKGASTKGYGRKQRQI